MALACSHASCDTGEILLYTSGRGTLALNVRFSLYEPQLEVTSSLGVGPRHCLMGTPSCGCRTRSGSWSCYHGFLGECDERRIARNLKACFFGFRGCDCAKDLDHRFRSARLIDESWSQVESPEIWGSLGQHVIHNSIEWFPPGGKSHVVRLIHEARQLLSSGSWFLQPVPMRKKPR